MTAYKMCWRGSCRRSSSHEVSGIPPTMLGGNPTSRNYCLDHAAEVLLAFGNVSVVPIGCVEGEVESSADAPPKKSHYSVRSYITDSEASDDE